MSFIEVDAMSTPIKDGDFVLKKSSAEENFSAIMAGHRQMLTNYIKLWQQVWTLSIRLRFPWVAVVA
jgi:hypothetical protein